MGETTRAKKRRYFTEERREVYLDCLRMTASHRAAAKEAGVSEQAARRFRGRNLGYASLCSEAEAEARRRLAGTEGPFEGPLDPTFESIRRGPKGEAKIVRTGKRNWNKKIEERFLAVLRECGNIAAGARAIGFTRAAVWQRRRKWPSFARAMEEAMEEAEIALEFRLLCAGSGWSEAAEPELEDGEPLDVPAAEIDPEFALKFLKWREEKRRGQRSAVVAFPNADEVRERIIAKVLAVKRHRKLRAKREGESGDES